MTTCSTSPQPLAPGDWIADRYELLRRLGRGGMGEVFAARDRHTGVDVAIKLLRSRSPEDRRRMLREARVTATISHRNVVSIWEVGVVGPDCFLALELLDGETVAARLERSGVPSLSTAVGWLDALLDALAATHRVGAVHRDVKPDNLFLQRGDRGERLKLIDFGLSKAADDDVTISDVGSVVGTPGYMAPEQLMALDADARTDIYGFGLTAYEILTGRPPFEAHALAAMLAKPPDPPSTLHPALGPAVDAVLLRALAKQPQRRYADVEALRVDWRAALETLGQ